MVGAIVYGDKPVPKMTPQPLGLKVFRAGYLLCAIGSTSKDDLQRRYVVLKDQYLYYYVDRATYEATPRQTLRKRPTDLEDYVVEVEQTTVPVKLRLVPREDEELKTIELGCEALSESMEWIAAFHQAMQLSKKPQVS